MLQYSFFVWIQVVLSIAYPLAVTNLHFWVFVFISNNCNFDSEDLNLRNIVVYHINILRYYMYLVSIILLIYFSFSEYTYIIAL